MNGRAIIYSDDELAWIRRNCDLSRADLHRRFTKLYGRHDVTVDNIKGLCSRMGWSAGPEGRRRNKGRSLILSPEECAWLRANAGLSRAELLPAFQAAFPLGQASLAQIVAWRKREGVKTGRDGRFAKGHEPWTKGRKLPHNPNSAKTQFQKGQVSHTWRGAGHEAVDRHGYVWIIVDHPNPYTGAATWRVHKHRWLWEEANGPVPEGHALKCLDGNKLNTDPSNWDAIPRAMLPRLNGRFGRDYDDAPAEVKPALMATARLEHRIREMRKAPEAK